MGRNPIAVHESPSHRFHLLRHGRGVRPGRRVLLLMIEAFVIWRCLRAARLARDLSGAMIGFGVAILLFFESAANIAVNLRLIPVSGLPLPFISYGARA